MCEIQDLRANSSPVYNYIQLVRSFYIAVLLLFLMAQRYEALIARKLKTP